SRHTRSKRDWSSDVCSSDLNIGLFHYTNMDEFNVLDGEGNVTATPSLVNYVEGIYVGYKFYETAAAEGLIDYDEVVQYPFGYGRSEERRVGKERGLRWAPAR